MDSPGAAVLPTLETGGRRNRTDKQIKESLSEQHQSKVLKKIKAHSIYTKLSDLGHSGPNGSETHKGYI